jgi:hypothetical protein
MVIYLVWARVGLVYLRTTIGISQVHTSDQLDKIPHLGSREEISPTLILFIMFPFANLLITLLYYRFRFNPS